MWLVAASFNGSVGIEQAGQVLRAGGSALDAIEAGVRPVESNAQDDSVGLGGMPNVLGQVELDASIMDGRTLSAGAIGALQGYEHPISLARSVMEHSPHVAIVGDGARCFARDMGQPPCNLLTSEAEHKWRAKLRELLTDGEIDNLNRRRHLLPLVRELQDQVRRHGTVNFLARDAHGDIASGVSTSGWAWKYPGRLGDSPVIGAGNYADNRYGAAACTGYGELTMRCGSARSVVLYMKMGMTVEGACQEAMRDLQPLLSAQGGQVCILAIDRAGHPFSITSEPRGEPYLVLTDQSDAPQRVRPEHSCIEPQVPMEV
jgi:beta-aspartyl-peptidase (threonine type)